MTLATFGVKQKWNGRYCETGNVTTRWTKLNIYHLVTYLDFGS